MRDLQGLRFGRLTVVEEADRRGNLRYWLCVCDCGNERIVYQGSLTRRHKPTTSCSCGRNERIGNLNRLTSGESARRRRLEQYKRKAERSGLVFLLSDDEFFELTQLPCHYCGVPPYRTSQTKGTHYFGDFVYNGVDRKDSSLGYTKSNCVPCCRTCNLGKCESSYAEFLEYLNRVTQFRKGRVVISA